MIIIGQGLARKRGLTMNLIKLSSFKTFSLRRAKLEQITRSANILAKQVSACKRAKAGRKRATSYVFSMDDINKVNNILMYVF